MNMTSLEIFLKQTDAKGNVTRYEYDKNGSRTKIIFADDSYVQTEYDERGRNICIAKRQESNIHPI